MRIIFFVKGDRRLPSSRTRAYLVSDYLRSLGYQSEAHHVKTRAWWSLSPDRFRESVRNARLLLGAGKGDVVVLQRTVHQIDFLLLTLLRKLVLRRGYAFDFDDAIFLEKGHADLKTRLIVRYADVVFCGAEFLRQYALRHNGNAHVVTTAVDTENVFFPYGHAREGGEVVIGWTGSPVHLDNMRLLVDPLARLAAEGLPIRLLLIGGGQPIADLFRAVPNLRLTQVLHEPSAGFWGEPREVGRYIQNFDIGVYPLQKTEWNKGKDVYKAKEFAACGVPIAISNWGENPLIVEGGVDGVLVDDDGWYDALKRLVVDSDHRARMGRGARQFAERVASLGDQVSVMLRLLNVTEKP